MILNLDKYKIINAENNSKYYQLIVDLSNLTDDIIGSLRNNDIIFYNGRELIVEKIKFPILLSEERDDLYEYDDTLTDKENIRNLYDNLNDFNNKKIVYRPSENTLLITARENILYNRTVILKVEIARNGMMRTRYKYVFDKIKEDLISELNLISNFKVIPVFLRTDIENKISVVFDSNETFGGLDIEELNEKLKQIFNLKNDSDDENNKDV